MVAVLAYSGIVVPDLPPLAVVSQSVAIPAAALLLGGVSRQLGERNRRLAKLTEQLRHEQEHRTRQELARERLRIARELHDVVAHHMSVMSMQAGLAGYVFDSDPPTARAAVETIGRTGRAALDEMRRLLDLLRTSDDPDAGDPTEPTPGLDGLPALFDRVRAAGVALDEELSGPLRTLPSGLQMTTYRVVQEALTNVIKHAAPCRATVSVRYHAGELTVAVVNDGPPAAAPGDGGHGLIGIRERARTFGGHAAAGPRPGGGFAVALTIPAR